MIYQDDPGIFNWFVVFRPSEHRLVWFLKRQFQHVWAFTYDPASNTWLRVESTHKNLVIRPVPNKLVPYMLLEANKCVDVQYNAEILSLISG